MRYCVLGFRQSEEDSPKLTGQLVFVDVQSGEVLQVADRFRQLCRDALFILSVLRTAFRRGKEDSRKLTGQLVVVDPEQGEIGQVANTLRKLCRNELFSREVLRTGSGGARKVLGNSLVS